MLLIPIVGGGYNGDMSDDELFAKIEDLGHKLRRHEDGLIDEWVCEFDEYEGRGHNGPGCELCDQSWCVHCLRGDFEVEECPNRLTGRAEPYPPQTRLLEDNQ